MCGRSDSYPSLGMRDPGAPQGYLLHTYVVLRSTYLLTYSLTYISTQGYRELLCIELPMHAMRVHARLASGASVLLTDEMELTDEILSAVSFYVWACIDANDARHLGNKAELERRRRDVGLR